MPMQVRRFHYAWVVVAVTLVALMAGAGGACGAGRDHRSARARSSAGIAPAISLAVGLSLLAFGLGGPLGGWLIERFGPRTLLTGGDPADRRSACFALINMRELWQLYLVWGIVIGLGTGAAGQVASAAIAQRWFRTHRGLIVGLFGAATRAGQLVFRPRDGRAHRQRWAGARRSRCCLARGDRDRSAGALHARSPQRRGGSGRYGEGANASRPQRRPTTRAPTSLREAMRTRATFGSSRAASLFAATPQRPGRHASVPHAIEHGFTRGRRRCGRPDGAMNVVGTLASGWLWTATTIASCWRLLWFPRGLHAALPFIFETRGLRIFSIVYGLDWIATVPPTVNLTALSFGRGSLGTLFGWIFCAHMIGAGSRPMRAASSTTSSATIT